MTTSIYRGENGSLHELDPDKFGEERIAEQVRKGILTKVDAETLEEAAALGDPAAVDDVPAALAKMNVAALDEFIVDEGLPEELLEVTPKADKVAAIVAALDDRG